jgi:YHS domain-containing protein
VIRRFLWLAIIALLVWGVRRLISSRKEPQAGAPARGRIPRSDGEMVRDRVCNTFLPRERALIVEQDGATHFFCSETCRSRYLEGRRAAS